MHRIEYPPDPAPPLSTWGRSWWIELESPSADPYSHMHGSLSLYGVAVDH
jgi:hypothetical protein